jgi:serine/threonine protein kinase/Tol biopolymer transport system component
MADRLPNDPSSPHAFTRARAIFESALETDGPDRDRLVRDACGNDATLRATVERMLRADEAPHVLLDGGPVLISDRWAVGDVFLHFRIEQLIGRGGMGEVYQARDLSLNRDVALKVLPVEAVGTPADDDRMARLREEAHTLAALNHPNIATIHGLVECDGVRALVLELVDGQTLAEQIAEGPFSFAEAIAYARQIAGALEAAHERGIIHRDLKPSNVKRRPDGTVKLLDFGLAKIIQPVSSSGARASDSSSRLIDSPGAAIGTAAYMSPEQARGREGDRRSDIWAFGAVLFEVLSGERVFAGRDVHETLAAVTAGEIAWSRLPSQTPQQLRQLLARCLDRDAARRLRDIGEARIALDDLIDGTATLPTPAAPGPTRSALLLVAATAVLASGVIAVALWSRPASPAAPVTRFALTPPAERQLLVDPQSSDLAITPDGSRVVYKGGGRVDRTQLFVYRLDQLEFEPLTPPALPKGPFISPDGRWVGYFEPGTGSGAAFKKVPLTGGPPVFVSRLDGPSRGAVWIDDRTIIAGSGETSTGLLRLSPSGGEPVVLSRPNRERGEADHVWPQQLPGGRHVLFTITALTGGLDAAQVGVFDLESGSWRPVLPHASQAHYVSSGHVVYVAGGALWAIAFDPIRLQTLGTARVVVPQVVTLPTGAAEFDISDDGTLVYLSGIAASAAPRNLVWVDREGREEPIDAPPRAYANVRLSPDGTRVATEIEGDGHDIWVWDFARKSLTRVTSDPGIDQGPVWMPDARRLVFRTEAGGVRGALAMQAADGSGTVERLTDGARAERASFALADGSGIIFSDGAGPKLLRLDGARRVTRLLDLSQGGGDGALSPDERWMAYVALDAGTPYVFVSPYPDANASRILVTPAGGSQPLWSRDGRTLFYTALDGGLMSVATNLRGPIKIASPVPILTSAYYGGLTVLSRSGTYDVASDGRRFLMIKEPTNVARLAQMVVVRNWSEELKRLVPVGR